MAPDFQYFLRFSVTGRFGHTIPGVFIFTLPTALLALWIFHRFVKLPVVRLLPQAIQSRLTAQFGRFRFLGVTRFALIALSVLVGIATHILWDSFTHVNTWLYKHWLLLREPIDVPVLGRLPLYKVLQHGSTVIGLCALLVWLVLWYRRTNPSPIREPLLASSRRIAVVMVLMALAGLGASIRTLWEHGFLADGASRRFVGDFVVTSVALIWWELVAYGVFRTLREGSDRSLLTARERT